MALVAVLSASVAVPSGVALASTPGTMASRIEASAGPARATGRVVVAYEPGRLVEADAVVRSAGGTAERRVPSAGFMVIEPPAGVAPGIFAAALEAETSIRWTELETVLAASFVPNDPEFGRQWNMERVGAPDAWEVERGVESVVVALVDSGVDLDHPDLRGRVDTVRDFDFVDRDDDADDAYGHGTHVAGIVAAATDNARDVAGLAHGCTLLPVRVLDGKGYGDSTVMAEGIRYAADAGADIINISAGGSDDMRVLSDAVEYAIAQGCVVVAAAGNKGIAGLDYPAAYPDVISVGSVDSDGARSSFSQYGDALDLVAPGRDILSLRPVAPRTGISIGMMSGTSMATPHVSAAAALLRSANPTWTAGLITHRLLATAEDLGAPGRDSYHGHGLLRADRALSALDLEGLDDDGIPGLPLPASPVVGLVDLDLDPVDVYSVTLSAGQWLRVRFKGSQDATFSLSLHSADATALTDTTVLEHAVSTGEGVEFTYVVPEGETAIHHLVVTALEGSGAYTIAWLRGHPTSIGVRAPKTSAWGGAATITGQVESEDEARLTGVRVVVDARPFGSAGWTVGVASAISDGDGIFRAKVRPKRRTAYRVRFEGAPGRLASASRSVEIIPRAFVAPPVPISNVRKGSVFTVTGALKPAYPAGERTVRITASLQDARGTWVARRSVRATNHVRDGSTRYAARLALPYAGRWRLVASVAGTDVHAATNSSPVYIVIR